MVIVTRVVKPRTHIRFIANRAKQQLLADASDHTALQRVAEDALIYTCTDMTPKPVSAAVKKRVGIEPAPPRLDLHDDLYRCLERDFYKAIYVERPLEKQILSNLGYDSTICITGYAGCGKSTFLRRMKRERPVTKHESLTIIDVARDPGHLSNPETFEKAICVTIYHSLWEEVARLLSTSFPSEFSFFRFRTLGSTEHQRLRAYVERSRFFTHEEQWSRFFTDNPHILEQENEIWLSEAITSRNRLDALLEFLRSLGHRTIIAFDNVDRLPIFIHDDIHSLAEDLGKGTPPLAHTIIALRINNYLLSYKSSHVPTYELGLRQDEPDTVCSYTIKRLRYALAYIRGITNSQSYTTFTHAPTYDMPSEDALRRFEDFILVLDDTSLLYEIARFHNDSFRSTAIDIYRMLALFFRPEEHAQALGGERLLLVFEGGVDENRRMLRTLLYRHMILDLRSLDKPRVLNLFDVSQPTRARQKPLIRLLRLHLLLYLRRRLTHTHETRPGERFTVPVHEIVRDFAFFGVDAAAVEKELIALAWPQPEESYGYIYIDVPMDDLFDLAPPYTGLRNKHAYILPSGIFMLETLGRTCEYIFWMALYAPLRLRLWDIEDHEAREYINDDSFRASVATTYVSAVLSEEVMNETNDIVNASDAQGCVAGLTLRTRYIQSFGLRASDPLYMEHLIRSIEAFLDNQATAYSIIGAGFEQRTREKIKLARHLIHNAKARLFK